MYTDNEYISEQLEGEFSLFLSHITNYADYDCIPLDEEDDEIIIDAFFNKRWDSCQTYNKIKINK